MLSNEVLTFGGLPVSNALHWDSSTHKALGSIVYKIISGLPKLRFEGYNEYWELKRQFISAEWCEYIDPLESYRHSLGHRRIADIIDEIGSEMVQYKRPQPHAKEDPVSSVPANTSVSTDHDVTQLVTVKCEQLSLF